MPPLRHPPPTESAAPPPTALGRRRAWRSAPLERVEVRSFGRLVLDMLPWLAPAATPAEQAMAAALEALGTACDQPDLAQVAPLGVVRAATHRQPERRPGLETRPHRLRLEATGDQEIEARIAQYEMAYRMQTSVPELTDVSDEPESTFRLYGDEARKPGTYAYNVLMARRLSERGTRFVQLFHRGWDTHGNLPNQLRARCQETDQASAALVTDLKQRGLLDETLVVWGGEFGRTVYCQGKLTAKTYGRDHHPRCFSIWLAGGGIKPGHSFGETDDYSYNITRDPISVHDLHATILALLGVDHERLTYRDAGRDFRLTDVAGRVVSEIFA